MPTDVTSSIIALITKHHKCNFCQLNGSMKEPNMFRNYETEKITRKASGAAKYIELFGSSTRHCDA